MDNQPPFDRSILIPILISGFSVIGIIVVLIIGRRLSAPAEIAVTPSATRFQYVYLGTEPAITTPLGEGSEIPLTEDPFEEPGEEEPTDEPVISATATLPAISTPIVLATPTGGVQQTNTVAPTSNSASVPPLNAGTYDDAHPNILKDGWEPSNTGGSTLHVSVTPGSTISFRFIGTQLRVLYQSGPTLGEVRITIDNVAGTLDESNEANEWVSQNFANGTHTVLITHTAGGSVNLDQVIVPEVPTTATPTFTPTP